MKKSLILILLIICMPFSYSIEVEDVGEVSVEPSLEEVKEGLTRYVYGAGLVASVKDSKVSYYHSDRIQSNRVVSDSFGEIVKEFKSLPFGQEISNSGVRYAFATGKELDSSGLYYFGARYYDSDLGRFTSVDPVKENEPYSYVSNNPLYFVDPSGMDETNIGKELHKWARERISDSAFILGGRGDVYYDPDDNWKKKKTPAGLNSYDCIGFIISGLSELYDLPISKFPPNLKLVEMLEEEYGWTSYIVEPASLIGYSNTHEKVKNIKEGSIILELHQRYGESIEQNDDPTRYVKHSYYHTTYYLELGHSLIKSKGISFINAIYSDSMLPAAKEHNAELNRDLFEGEIRESELVPSVDFLYVIEPPD